MEKNQAELELSVIKKIMEDSRNVVMDNGIHYIFWGIIVTAALLVNYIMLLTTYKSELYRNDVVYFNDNGCDS